MSISFPLALPAIPAPRTVTFGANNIVSIAVSPFTGSSQIQEWPGEWWEADVGLPPMTRAVAEAWINFLTSLRGQVGTFLLGDPARKTPNGIATGTPLVNGTQYGGSKILVTNGWTASQTGILKAGDYIQVGCGQNATRIQTSGGSNATKYYLFVLTPAVYGQVYTTSLVVNNTGTKDVRFSSNGASGAGSGQTVAAGTQAVINLIGTGDGVNALWVQILATSAGDSLDFYAWGLVQSRFGVNENLVPAANQTFVGGTVVSGATVTVTTGISQRLYKVLTDANSDGSGNAILDIFPRLRPEGALGGSVIVTASPTGVFRLSGNWRQWQQDYTHIVTISFKVVEAL